MDKNLLVCKSCGMPGSGKYCSNCGQAMEVKRLTLQVILHEVFHYFTHLDKGFLYTLKMLVQKPGKMQKEYIEGSRIRHQKPFSMFFISATVCGLIFYWVNNVLIKYFGAGDTKEANFFHNYWVLLQVGMLPFYCLIVYFCFRKAKHSYGEIMVFQLYTFSFLFLLLAFIHLFKFLNHNMEARYFELPLIIGYAIITNLNFFAEMKKGMVILMSIVSIILIFILAAFIQDELITWIY